MAAQMLRSIWGDTTVLEKAPEITALENDYYIEVRGRRCRDFHPRPFRID